MYFANPSALWALFGVLVPIVVHLVDLQRPKKVYFSNVAKLQSIHAASKSSRVWKEWLLMCIRSLVVALVALAFAQPRFSSATQSDNAAPAVLIIVDNSLSMSAKSQGSSLLDIAVRQTQDIARLYPISTPLYLFDLDLRPSDKAKLSPQDVKSRLGTMQISGSSHLLSEVLSQSLALLKVAYPTHKLHVYILSDFQKNQIGEVSQSLSYLSASDLLQLIPVQTESAYNVGVDTVWMDTYFPQLGQTITLHTKIKNYSEARLSAVEIGLQCAGTPFGAQTTSLEPFQSKVLDFKVNGLPANNTWGTLSVKGDQISFDNQFYFYLHPPQAVSVLCWGNPESYLVKALSNEPNFKLTVVKSGISPSPLQWQSAELLVLDPIHKNALASEALANWWKQSGKSTLMVPDPNLSSTDLLQLSLLTGTTYKPSEHQPDPTDALLALKEPDLRYTFFDGIFEKTEENMKLPYASPSLLMSSAATSLLQNRYGQTVFSYVQNSHLHRIYTFQMPLSEPYSSIQKDAIFVPIAYKVAQLSTQPTLPMSMRFNQSIDLSLTKASSIDQVLKLRKDLRTWIPVQRRLQAKVYAQLSLENAESGIYELLEGDSITGRLALNSSSAESQLQYLSAIQLNTEFSAFSGTRIQANAVENSDMAALRSQVVAKEYWPWLIVAALVMLAIETLVLRLSYIKSLFSRS